MVWVKQEGYVLTINLLNHKIIKQSVFVLRGKLSFGIQTTPKWEYLAIVEGIPSLIKK
jgi:hypothetical protein